MPRPSALASPGTLWIAYPKGSSKTQTDLTRDAGWDAVRDEPTSCWLTPRLDRRALVGLLAAPLPARRAAARTSA